ncbi:phosphatidylethanolamine-binding protein [Zychaea mexicana]|uniref:phosphatidylethanolamine-binding protein n=1 Tax=Zychaea mexicana TaxID=64656 RepID=UPI0022FE0C02|nr:phosphatidylethanolamine-binding protein [Zychaea mexicana]KAI9492637.1 phosphatidylethanolamine-binding protein [Zychaea mexicana]
MTKQLRMGMTTTTDETVKSPHVWFSKTNDLSQYTLMMIDPDAGDNGPYLHWIVTNIDGQKPASDVDNKEHQHTTYDPPAPLAESGPHRYIFAVYEQSEVNRASFTPVESRENFDFNKFAEDNGLKLVGALYMMQEASSS